MARWERCYKCGGSGKETCSRCNGSGKVRGRVNWNTFYTCSQCGGSGTEPCSNCRGYGYEENEDEE